MGIFNNNNNSSGNGSNFGGRFISGLLIALFGLFMYFSHSQENPVTHQKQHISLTPAQEIRLGLDSAPMMTSRMGGEVATTDPRHQEVNRIGQLIVSNTEASTSPWKFKFHLLSDTHSVNAFALPGGQIFITLGLLNKLQTEAQLAGVLSHEMGHVIERHSAQQMAKSELGQMLVIGVGIGSSDSNHQYSNSPMVIASIVNQIVQLRYSRHDESQADIWGVKLMEEVGFDPRAMIEVMEILKASTGVGHEIEMFETHPNPDLRIEQINAYLSQHPPKSGLKQGRDLKDVY